MYVHMTNGSQLNIPSWEVHRLQPYFASLAIPFKHWIIIAYSVVPFIHLLLGMSSPAVS